VAFPAECIQTVVPILGPVLDGGTDVFGPIFTTNNLGFLAPGNDLLQSSDHPLRRQREVHLNAQRLAIEVINDVEQPQIPAVFELVMHEVHGPDLIDGIWNGQWFRLLPHQASSGLDAQVELQLEVDAIHAFVVPAKALYVAQIQVTQAKSPVAMVIRQSHQPVSYDFVLSVLLGFVAVAGLADRLASVCNGRSLRGLR